MIEAKSDKKNTIKQVRIMDIALLAMGILLFAILIGVGLHLNGGSDHITLLTLLFLVGMFSIGSVISLASERYVLRDIHTGMAIGASAMAIAVFTDKSAVAINQDAVSRVIIVSMFLIAFGIFMRRFER